MIRMDNAIKFLNLKYFVRNANFHILTDLDLAG